MACYHRDFMLFPHIDGYVCLTCGVAIERPTAETGHLRCPDGHFVDGIKSGPLWATGVNAHFATLGPLALVAAVLRWHWMDWVAVVVVLGWSAYIFVLGILLPRERAEIKMVGAQFMVTGLARGCAAAVVAWWLLLQ